MTVAQVQTNCPDCGSDLHLRAQPGWKYSPLSLTLFAIAGMSSFLCFPYFMQLASDSELSWQMVVLGLALLAGMSLSLLAWKLPRVRPMRCGQCGWQSRIQNRKQRPSR